jgi:hypothetical protein
VLKKSHGSVPAVKLKPIVQLHDFAEVSVAELRRAHFGKETPLHRVRPAQPMLGCGCVYCLHLEQLGGESCPWECEWCIAMGIE